MHQARVASQALRLATEPMRQPYICRSCARQFSSTPSNAAERSYWQQMKDNMFGSKESKRATESRQEKQKKKLEQIAKHGQKEIRHTKDKKGRQYEFARIVDENTHEDYTPAKNWSGLERVGGEKWVRQRADQGEVYVGFVAQQQVSLTNFEWQKLLHHIAVEVLVLQKAGRDVREVCNARAQDAQNWQLTATTAITPVDGVPSLSSLGAAQEQDILNAILHETNEAIGISQEAVKAELGSAIAEDVELTYIDGKIGWMDITLQDPEVKLAILKRIMQLSGRRISDPLITNAMTLKDLFNAFKVKEKPAKLAKLPEIQGLSYAIPNIKVHGSRRTVVHKEKDVGRWKLITDELRLRDLPVFRRDSKYSKEDKEVEKWQGFESKRGATSKADTRRGM